MRKQIQEKLIKFATRVPVFMYLTDYRERSLKDVITQLEPGLFKKVTGLDVKDFELLCSLGVFNANLMNDAIFKFKRYEDSSLSYTGIDKHEGEDVGGWDITIKKEEYEKLFYNQQSTMRATESEPIYEEVEEAEETEETTALKTPDKPDLPRSESVTEQFGVKPAAPKIEEPKEAAPKPKFEMPEISEGMTVVHKNFGEGVIAKLDKAQKKINVKFASGEKTFVVAPGSEYNAFERGFLRVK